MDWLFHQYFQWFWILIPRLINHRNHKLSSLKSSSKLLHKKNKSDIIFNPHITIVQSPHIATSLILYQLNNSYVYATQFNDRSHNSIAWLISNFFLLTLKLKFNIRSNILFGQIKIIIGNNKKVFCHLSKKYHSNF